MSHVTKPKKQKEFTMSDEDPVNEADEVRQDAITSCPGCSKEPSGEDHYDFWGRTCYVCSGDEHRKLCTSCYEIEFAKSLAEASFEVRVAISLDDRGSMLGDNAQYVFPSCGEDIDCLQDIDYDYEDVFHVLTFLLIGRDMLLQNKKLSTEDACTLVRCIMACREYSEQFKTVLGDKRSQYMKLTGCHYEEVFFESVESLADEVLSLIPFLTKKRRRQDNRV